MGYLLVVDDDASIRDVLCDVIEEAGYRATAVENGREALLYLKAHPPPFLILLDLMMPVMDGQQFRREQRRIPDLANIPVAVLSANVQAEHGEDWIGTVRFKKPVELEQLLEVVHRFGRCAKAP
jgi:CheY-like chemotaxis protein